jgi:WD40 repeat protein
VNRSLEGHEKAVNVLRFSPSGRALASASDGGAIIVYIMPDNKPLRFW